MIATRQLTARGEPPSGSVASSAVRSGIGSRLTRATGHLLYDRKYFATSREPSTRGIDPYNLLEWEEGDNIEALTIMTLSARGQS